MIFTTTPIAGALLVAPERLTDERGYFARLWCAESFAAQGIAGAMVQSSVSYNRLAGTVRALHYARAPAQEGKLVRAQRGRIHDVIVDLRADSPSYLQHFSVELSAASQLALYVPPGVAHGFQTLEDDCEIVYLMTEAYRPDCAAGVRYNDPAFGIEWPLPVSLIAERDANYPDFS